MGVSLGLTCSGYHEKNHGDELPPHVQSNRPLSLLYVHVGLGMVSAYRTVCLRFAIIPKYFGCAVWVFVVFWGTLFQLAVSPYNWIDKAMEDVGEKVWKMLSAETAHKQTVEGQANQMEEDNTIVGLARNYPWWTPKKLAEEKNEAVLAWKKAVFQGKSTV